MPTYVTGHQSSGKELRHTESSKREEEASKIQEGKTREAKSAENKRGQRLNLEEEGKREKGQRQEREERKRWKGKKGKWGETEEEGWCIDKQTNRKEKYCPRPAEENLSRWARDKRDVCVEHLGDVRDLRKPDEEL